MCPIAWALAQGRTPMRYVRLPWLMAAAIFLSSVFAPVIAEAADLSKIRTYRSHTVKFNRYCQELWRCGPAGCNWHEVCTRPCPDGYSCSPLYGAYGPYGGVAYWGAYTDSGWSYYR